jgi:3-hydroxyisobutyrate dehydrogenase
MAMNILKGGYEVVVHNRDRNKEKEVADKGALRAKTPAMAAQNADIVITCVSDTPDVEAVLLEKDSVLAGAQEGCLVIDMSTISPSATRRMAQRLAEKKVRMIDAPVSGGSEGAQLGTLAIMIGGDVADVEKARPVLETMGKTITHVGPIGAGQVTKAINQVVIAATYLGVAEGMALGMKAGLDMQKVIKAIAGGAAGSWVLNNRADFMVKNDYPLGFRVRLHAKDLKIALDTSRELGVTLPVASIVEQLESGLIGRGYGDEDVSAMARAIREMSGLKDD